jgi:hypothetical protein
MEIPGHIRPERCFGIEPVRSERNLRHRYDRKLRFEWNHWIDWLDWIERQHDWLDWLYFRRFVRVQLVGRQHFRHNAMSRLRCF